VLQLKVQRATIPVERDRPSGVFRSSSRDSMFTFSPAGARSKGVSSRFSFSGVSFCA